MIFIITSSKKVNRKFVLVGDTARANPTLRVLPYSDISMNKSKELKVFHGRQKLTSANN